MKNEPEIVKKLRKEEKLGFLHLINNRANNEKQIYKVNIKEPVKKSSNFKVLTSKVIDNEERYQILVEDISDWIWEVDRDGRYTYVSPKVKDFLGYTPEEVTGRKIFEFMPTNEAKRIFETFQACVIMLNPIVRLENKNIHKNGKKITLETSGIPVFNSNGDLIGFRGISRNVTDRKKLENELIQKNDELVRINKELEDYNYVISHDLKEPLRSLQVFSDLLLDDKKSLLSKEGKDFLIRIKKASFRMSQLVDDLLILARIGQEGIEFEEVDLNKLLLEVKEELAGLLKEKKAELDFDTLPVLKCNNTLLAELFKNLISNGFKFNKNEKPKVTVSYEENDYEYLFRVSDNGIGIEEKYLEKIFDIFKRLHSKEEYEGTGAGLTICKRIVEKHGGSIWVENLGLDTGTIFYFTIPKNIRGNEVISNKHG